MYWKIFSNVCCSMMPLYNVNLRYSKVVEFKTPYFVVEDYVTVHVVSLEKYFK